MKLLPGFRIAVAPRFHLSSHWQNQIHICNNFLQSDDRHVGQPAWREPDTDERSILLRETPIESPEDLQSYLLLVELPNHLRQTWWRVVDNAVEFLGKGPLPGFDGFMDQVSEFLVFKNLPFPEDTRGDVVLTFPGVDSETKTTHAAGLRSSLAPWISWPFAREQENPHLWGGFNLGEEASSLIFINLSCLQQERELHRLLSSDCMPVTIGELTSLFLRNFTDYPLVSLTLQPGQGYILPQGGMILDHAIAEKAEPDFHLLISGNPGGPAGQVTH